MTFKILRYYSIASLVGVLAAAAAIVAIYRTVAIRGIEAVAENSNLAMAQIAITPIRAQLAEFLARASEPREPAALPLPAELDAAINDLMTHAQVIRVKLYDRQGRVVFSTKNEQIGTQQPDNPGFVAAMKGRVSVKLVYRDTLNPFDGATEDDNLVQSYIPVRRRATEPVAGVFEVYTDVSALVAQAERSEYAVLAATLLVLATLYFGLLLWVRHAGDLIRAQALTIREKSAQLEKLSRESLRREESERKKIATDLHEGLAQTLSAVKLAIEGARALPGPARERLDDAVGELQEAIDMARSIAVDLRPPSLDDLGLVPTIGRVCADFADRYPGVHLEQHFSAPEALIPGPLKIVIYRTIDATLRIVGQRRTASRISLSLGMDDRELELAIQADGAALSSFGPADMAGGDSPFAAVRERVIISGGGLEFAHGRTGELTLHATWSLVAQPLVPEAAA